MADQASVRSDAQANRRRILDVALTELSRSADVPMSTIAKKAGVGQGTLYRHFPDRNALVLEIHHQGMQHITTLAAELLKTRPPDQALREWMHHLGSYAIVKAGLADAFRHAADAADSPGTPVYAPMFAAADLLLRAAEDAGTIRPGVSAHDFFLAVAGLWYLDADAEWRPRLTWLLELVMDGLRTGAPVQHQPPA